MDDFIKSLSSPYWLMSVVVVGILINLVSNFLQRYFDAQFSSASTWWRQRSEKNETERKNELNRLRGNSHAQMLFAFEEVRERLTGLLQILFGLFVVVILLISEGVFPLPSLLGLFGVILLLGGLRYYDRADYKARLLRDSQIGHGDL